MKNCLVSGLFNCKVLLPRGLLGELCMEGKDDDSNDIMADTACVDSVSQN